MKDLQKKAFIESRAGPGTKDRRPSPPTKTTVKIMNNKRTG